MEIGVLSGKGGAGKTFVATNLARVIENAYYIDCDVEEPNGHLFFKGERIREETVYVKIPTPIKDRCTGCRECVDFCRFNALSYVGENLLVFEDICHSCGGCSLVCKEDALVEVDRPVGKIISEKDRDTNIYTGLMNIGESSGTPIINRLKDSIERLDATKVIDCPPGTACSVMDSIKNNDFCLVVVEPTVFGLHNFKMVHKLLKIFSKELAVVINKSLGDKDLIEDYCRENDIEILLDIPFDRELARKNAEASLVVDESKEYRKMFTDLYNKISRRVAYEETTNS